MRAALMAGLVAGFTVMAGAAPAFAAGNPSGTGLPSQSCQDIVAPVPSRAVAGTGHHHRYGPFRV